MRKMSRGWFVAALLILGAFTIWSCAVPDLDLVEPENDAGNNAVAADPNVGTPDINQSSGQIPEEDMRFELRFDENMDGDSFVAGTTVRFHNVNDDADVDVTVEYIDGTRTLFVNIAEDLDPDEAFLLILSGAVTNSTGTAMDGNGNGVADGTPYDDVRWRYYTGSAPPEYSDIDFSPPRVTSTSPSLGGSGNVSVTPTIRVNFNRSMDQSTLDTDNFTLEDGITRAEVDITQSGVGSGFVEFQPDDDLDYATVYRFTIHAEGILGEEDATGDEYLQELDTDYDGADETDSDLFFTFLTTDDPGDDEDDATPPDVIDWGWDDEFVYVDFDDEMDLSTLTSDNVRLFQWGDWVEPRGGGPSPCALTGWHSFPADIIINPSERGLRLTFDNVVYNRYYLIVVSQNVMDDAGWKLDGNDNGLGGEPNCIWESGDAWRAQFYAD
jgi:hypothetical protein